MSVYKMTEWEQNGKWHCIDTSNFKAGSAMWWIPCRILGMTPAEFTQYLLDNNANISWNPEIPLLLWSFDKQSDMRRVKNHINKVAREINFLI